MDASWLVIIAVMLGVALAFAVVGGTLGALLHTVDIQNWWWVKRRRRQSLRMKKMQHKWEEGD